MSNSPYTMFSWSTDSDNRPIINMNGKVFNYEEVVKLRDELNRLIPQQKVREILFESAWVLEDTREDLEDRLNNIRDIAIGIEDDE